MFRQNWPGIWWLLKADAFWYLISGKCLQQIHFSFSYRWCVGQQRRNTTVIIPLDLYVLLGGETHLINNVLCYTHGVVDFLALYSENKKQLQQQRNHIKRKTETKKRTKIQTISNLYLLTFALLTWTLFLTVFVFHPSSNLILLLFCFFIKTMRGDKGVEAGDANANKTSLNWYKNYRQRGPVHSVSFKFLLGPSLAFGLFVFLKSLDTVNFLALLSFVPTEPPRESTLYILCSCFFYKLKDNLICCSLI